MNWKDKQSVFPSIRESIRESQQKILAHDANLVEQFYSMSFLPFRAACAMMSIADKRLKTVEKTGSPATGSHGNTCKVALRRLAANLRRQVWQR
jgi:hypothetical protein